MVPPNVVIVTTHDTGRFIEPYGVRTVQTPRVKRLAETGARFNAYTTAPQCSPSRASLTTGRYPHANGTMGLTHSHLGWDLHPGECALPRLLRPAGYRSGHFGVEHASRDGRALGNDVFDGERDPDTMLQNAAAFLDATGGGTFFLQIGFSETHRVERQHFGNRPFGELGVTVPAYLVDGPETRADVADFQGCVNRADRLIGRVMTLLDGRGLTDQTLFIYVSDHGIAFPRAKCTLYDPGIEISLLVRLPGSDFSGGQTPHGMVSIMDVVPTILELAGVDLPDNLHGRSLLPMVRGESRGWDTLFCEKTYHSYYDPMRGLRTDRWKYIRNFEAGLGIEIPADIAGSRSHSEAVGKLRPDQHPPAEFYDLDADPGEQANLAGRPEVADIEQELDGRLKAWMRETKDPLLGGPIASPFYRAALDVAEASTCLQKFADECRCTMKWP